MRQDLEHILDHTRDLWEELRGQRVFVTGGTGFIGRWLLESFAWANDRLKLGAEALVLTRNAGAFAGKMPHLSSRSDIQFHPGDVRDFQFPGGEFSHFIHAATEASATLNDEHPEIMLDTIVGGTRRALELAAGQGGRKFVLTSSGAVYGTQPPTVANIPEEYSGAPDTQNFRSAYGEGKRLAELLCAIHGRNGNLQPKIARCFAFVGPHLPFNAHFAIGNFIRDALAGGPIKINGDGTPYRSYLYAADLAIWLWTILFRGAPNHPYNVGSGQPVSIAETAEAVSEVFGGIKIAIARKPIAGQLAARYVPDVTRAKTELGLSEEIDLKESIRRTVQWARAQSAG